MKLFYSNKEDPRVYVYKDENGPSGMGVTLNFAHRKAWAVMAAEIALMLPVVCVVNVNAVRHFLSSGVFVSLLVTYCVCFVAISIVVAYRGASRDLKRYPGPKGPRERKGTSGAYKLGPR